MFQPLNRTMTKATVGRTSVTQRQTDFEIENERAAKKAADATCNFNNLMRV
jgi:hypothetical protein